MFRAYLLTTLLLYARTVLLNTKTLRLLKHWHFQIMSLLIDLVVCQQLLSDPEILKQTDAAMYRPT